MRQKIEKEREKVEGGWGRAAHSRTNLKRDAYARRQKTAATRA